MPDTPNVSSATERLLSALAEGAFEYALVGGLAVVLHGYDRYTRDVDALVWNLDDRLEELVGLLRERGFRLADADQLATARASRILHLLADDDTAVDVFLGFLPFEQEAIKRATAMTLREGVTGRVITPEDLIIMKLIASRSRDLYDVIALVDLYPDLDKDRIRTIVRDYAETLERPDILKNLEERIV
ncbi:MAG: nucleotidyltransferase [Fimbriimonadaceae bacterium]|nr:nucleotidyltransferase [Fimbriimonadaceae bacterium]